jgi:putative amide transporter protein
MTLALLILIAVMWVPVALLNLGYGEAKGTGAVSGVVGLVVVIGALIQAALFKDAFGAGLLFAHGTLYICVSYALLAGLEDFSSIGNVSLTVAIISAIYAYVYFVGSKQVPITPYLSMMCAGYTVLTLEVWLNFYGKLSGKVVALSLLVWAVVGLWIPAFQLLTAGTLPF